jgi:predicted lipoprotein
MGNRNKKLLNYSLLVILSLFLIYNSVYFENLDARRQQLALKHFDPAEYVSDFWHKKVPANLTRSIPATDLLSALNTDIVQTGQKFGRTLGLASTYFFLISGEGRVLDLTDEGILLAVFKDQNSIDILIATNFIYGNAIRDASGLIDVSDFPNSMEFNSISSEINKVVTYEVIPLFLNKVRVGDEITFFGATEVNKDEPELNPLRVIPIQVKINE